MSNLFKHFTQKPGTALQPPALNETREQTFERHFKHLQGILQGIINKYKHEVQIRTNLRDRAEVELNAAEDMLDQTYCELAKSAFYDELKLPLRPTYPQSVPDTAPQPGL